MYKLISDNKDSSNKSSIDKLWRAFMTMPDAETFKRGKPIVESKQHLIKIVTELEKDNLVMHAEEDGSLIII